MMVLDSAVEMAEGKEVCHNAFAMLNDSREREHF